MCGIAGFIGPVESDGGESVLRRMTDAIVHRGPDDVGVWHDAGCGVGLGHRRLSILDLSPEGHQPMWSPTRRFGVVFNGEIYNFRELRRALEGEGVRFRGGSDTEVLLAAFERWGLEATLGRIAGMFALALWDATERVVHLVRDRVGEKPLYYAPLGEHLLFGSELKAMRQHPAWRGGIDSTGLALFLRHGYIQAPHTIHPDVRKVRPGHVVSVPVDRPGEWREWAYWSLEDVARAGIADPFQGSPEELLDELDALLRRVVGDEMVADVPVGAFLSGGIDSSLIVALMQAQGGLPARSFTIAFDDPRFNEAAHAKAVAAHLGTEHTETPITEADVLAYVPRLGQLFDEPFADQSQLPTLLLSAITRRHVTVALTGDGGDEFFAGYTQYMQPDRLWNTLARVPRLARRPLAEALAMVPAPLVEALPLRAGRAPGESTQLLRRARRLLRGGNDRIAYEDLLSRWAEPRRLLRAPVARDAMTLSWLGGDDPVRSRMLADQQSYLTDDVLVKVDRSAMAASLETRAPLLDHRVIELSWRIPTALSLRDGVGKWPLRQLLYRYVPRQLVDRPKQGFAVPLGTWLRGPLREWSESLLAPDALRGAGLHPAPVRALWSAHLRGDADRSSALWPVLMFVQWQRATA